MIPLEYQIDQIDFDHPEIGNPWLQLQLLQFHLTQYQILPFPCQVGQLGQPQVQCFLLVAQVAEQSVSKQRKESSTSEEIKIEFYFHG